MKTIKGWWVPSSETEGIKDILNEWWIKGETILNLLENTRVCVQAGGNVGVFPFYLSKYFREVHTFEPIPSNMECLERNIIETDNIYSHLGALGTGSMQASLVRSLEGNCGATQIQEDMAGDLEVIDLDGLTLEEVDLLWLDVEGFEVKALEGARDTIERCSPLIVAENNGLIHEFPGDRDGSQAFRDWMKNEFNYTLHSRMMRDDIFIQQ